MDYTMVYVYACLAMLCARKCHHDFCASIDHARDFIVFNSIGCSEFQNGQSDTDGVRLVSLAMLKRSRVWGCKSSTDLEGDKTNNKS